MFQRTAFVIMHYITIKSHVLYLEIANCIFKQPLINILQKPMMVAG